MLQSMAAAFFIDKLRLGITDLGYKDMDESSGPLQYDCPVSILKLLSPTDNENTMEWRKKCYERSKKKNQAIENFYGFLLPG